MAETTTLESPDLDSGEVRARTPTQLVWRRFKRDRAALVSLIFIAFLVVLALSAPLVAKIVGHGPNELFRDMTDDFGLPKGPNGSFVFGADTAGRDVLVRIAYGTRVSLFVGIAATAISVTIGVVLGLVAGYRGGIIDTIVSRITDVVLSLPLLLFAIGIVTACGSSREGCLAGTVEPGLGLVIIVIVTFTWPLTARVVRGAVLSLREREFVEASRSLGAGDLTIMFREILPNVMSVIIVYASLLIPANILFEAYLSFLGLGVPDSTPSWGRMISDATGIFDVAWWLMLFPGIFLLMTVLAFNVLGDGVRDALDPRTDR
ncbi:MAG: ABC transporter permease [Thermoleophilia bacterium]|nr:ABC transporter permease [Thermoleophilia bacterium]